MLRALKTITACHEDFDREGQVPGLLRTCSTENDKSGRNPFAALLGGGHGFGLDEANGAIRLRQSRYGGKRSTQSFRSPIKACLETDTFHHRPGFSWEARQGRTTSGCLRKFRRKSTFVWE